MGLEHMWVRTSFLALEYSSSPRAVLRLFCMKKDHYIIMLSYFLKLSLLYKVSENLCQLLIEKVYNTDKSN